MWRRVPIRWRLTGWYAALLAAALVILGVALYFGLREQLYANFDDQLHSQANLLLTTVQVKNGDQLAFAPNQNRDPENGEHFVRLLNTSGQSVSDTSTALNNGVPVDPVLVRAALQGETLFSSRQVDGQTLRIVTLPVRNGDTVVGVLQLGAFRGDVDDALNTLLVTLAIMAPAVLLLAGIGGYLLAGRALAPVAAITRLAGGIGADDLHARLNLPLPDDELGQLARTFDSMLARIEDAFSRQRRFTGDAAHEMRTPLSLMRGWIDLALARPRSPAQYREVLRDLDDELARLTDLVATLLALARADSDRIMIERAPFDLANTIGLVLEQYAPTTAEQGVSLKGETAPCPIEADEDRLVQVLVNLLDNALAHTPAGGTIVVGCRRDESECRLWVADTGTGIAPEHLPHVFDRFYRADSGRARAQGGAGLGLSITRAIIEAHGGTIALTSEPDQGTRVDIGLPAGA